MSRTRSFLLLLAACLVASGTVVAGCGWDADRDERRQSAPEEDRSESDESDHADDHDEVDDEADEPADPTPLPEPVPAGQLPPIAITTPAPLQDVHASFVLTGTAQVFEGDLRWALLDATLTPMVSGRMTATCGAPCRGKFRVRVPLAKVQPGSWELHVWAPPVADDDPPRVHDTMVPITVNEFPVANPDPGAAPPGGAPQ